MSEDEKAAGCSITEPDLSLDYPKCCRRKIVCPKDTTNLITDVNWKRLDNLLPRRRT